MHVSSVTCKLQGKRQVVAIKRYQSDSITQLWGKHTVYTFSDGTTVDTPPYDYVSQRIVGPVNVWATLDNDKIILPLLEN